MIILSKDERTIQISSPAMMNECVSKKDEEVLYIIESPKIICNNKNDAEHIQRKLNEFAVSLSRTLLK